MFTGIVSDVGTLLSAGMKGRVRRLRISSAYPARGIALGASIAVDGVCMTVVAKKPMGKGSWFEVEAGKETLSLTTAGRWQKGKKLNLERALKIGDELGGHIVTGHIDGIARLRARKDTGKSARFDFAAPKQLARFIAKKGSVALDGISLTVNDVKGNEFSVFLIPHSLQHTHWAALKPGDAVNIEIDMMARYAARLAEAKRSK